MNRPTDPDAGPADRTGPTVPDPGVTARQAAPDLREVAELLERSVSYLRQRPGPSADPVVIEVFIDAATSIRLTAAALEHVVRQPEA